MNDPECNVRGIQYAGHYRERCVCGNWLGQCRCIKRDKEIRIIEPCKCASPGPGWIGKPSVLSAPANTHTISVTLEKYGLSDDQKRVEYAFYDERGDLQHGIAINAGAYRLLGEPDRITIQVKPGC